MWSFNPYQAPNNHDFQHVTLVFWSFGLSVFPAQLEKCFRYGSFPRQSHAPSRMVGLRVKTPMHSIPTVAGSGATSPEIRRRVSCPSIARRAPPPRPVGRPMPASSMAHASLALQSDRASISECVPRLHRPREWVHAGSVPEHEQRRRHVGRQLHRFAKPLPSQRFQAPAHADQNGWRSGRHRFRVPLVTVCRPWLVGKVPDRWRHGCQDAGIP